MTLDRHITLESGEVIEGVTRVVEPDENGFVNVHTPGGGYRVVHEDRIESDLLVDEQGEPLS